MEKRKAKRSRKKPRTFREWRELFRLAEHDQEAAKYVSRLLDSQKKHWLTDFSRLRMRQAEAEYQEAIKEKSKELPKDPPSTLFFAANGRLRELLQLANEGDREAARSLLWVLTENVERFLNLCLQKPTLVREIWRPGQPWPLLHTQLRRKGKGRLALPRDHVLRKIGIIPRRRLSKEAVATGVAIELYCVMDFCRSIGPQQSEGGEPLRPLVIKKAPGGKVDVIVKLNETVSSAYSLGHLARDLADAEQIKRIRTLAPLQPSNWHEWWKEAVQIFDKQWGPQFQDHPDFLNWGEAGYGRKKTKKGKPKKTRGIKRSDIKRAIKKVFRSLANNLQLVPKSPG
jgi:hypothetical protein